MAADLGLNQMNDEEHDTRESRNARRLWMVLFMSDAR
jgi:hypothetical protein